ncbi:hypothetical protein A3A71_01100 [Candidatus Berkelbacteria bacterium RIFCSPLOWO2_01_FULL_50_28]|uniref:Arginine deiminase n=1 Tax=Candidatus Berkelbacteria bacterium RIFCSPLOWO2_01_FULL_50_28 TaxID=1797471 RepID=A0A1F5EB71_9BACT|nr:MAG: hypothetical protein A2807_01670 [Candidatus Berkelbacteria bacterium RIFCSPHIGHO2_01_FULL_50_36]OGD64635.1 MAG: hypothetical protein A3A71_01100 [Candidatus Berkelbacteria bacterium RIFCSPLOWO2_01_FULL_50_28]
MMKPNVYSDVSRMTDVIVSRPDKAMFHVTSENFKEYLFDDLVDEQRAGGEHDVFTDLMRHCGINVHDVHQLLISVLSGRNRTKAAKMILEGSGLTYCKRLKKVSAETLAEVLITGCLPDEDVPQIVPLCNLTFTRDSHFVIGNRVFIANPKHNVRKREALIYRAIYTFHDQFRQPNLTSMLGDDWSIEGGDVMILSREVAVIGGVHRTHSRAAEKLSEILFHEMGFKAVFRVSFEVDGRDKMHLDTTFTMIDHGLCLVHAPVMLGRSAGVETSVLRCNTHNEALMWDRVPTLLDGLKSVGLELEPVICGGEHPTRQNREQWWDGCNTLALAPGVITIYDRCEATIRELEKAGFRVVNAADVKSPEDLDGKMVILMPSNELPKARGGWHCMAMSWWRD